MTRYTSNPAVSRRRRIFSSIAAAAFQGLAAVDIQHGDEEKYKRSCEEDEIAHGSNP
jgi:molybdopterin/thiamine biosynthesis adenylyltransferase